MSPNEYIIDNRILEIGKDTDGIMRTNKEVHDLLLKMVSELDRVCRKNNIQYALGFGSALGLNNYGGFIPWDDDMDIVIPYEEFPKFVEACKKDLSDEYIFDSYETNKKYNILIPTGKLRLKNTYLKDKNWLFLPNRCGSGDTFFIDVVTFMGVSKEHAKHRHAIWYSKLKIIPYVILDAIFHIHPYKMKERMKKYERKYYEKYKDSDYVSQSIIIPFQDISTIINKNAFPKDVIYPFREYEFEGKKLFSFNNVEEFCRLRYGEKALKKWDGEKYISTYPISKQKIRHFKEFNLYKSK